ncbi:hypothetical protein PENSPDRAFT_347267 [Peniophora sp. CONT]|nr:hypothetical protein PENSPDRAFT_347267 [Peniophora sp. CONT]
MADRLQNGFGFGQGFGANGLDGQSIGGIPNVEQTAQWAQFGQSHATNPNMNPQMAQLLIQRNSQAGAQMQANNNFQQHGLFEQQFGAAGGLLGNGQMNAMNAQHFNNAARAQQQPPPHQPPPFLPPNQELVRQMGLLQSQNNPLHQQQQATLNLLGQRLGQHGQQPHLSPQQQQQQQPLQQQQQQQPGRNILLTLVTNMGAPNQPRATANLINSMPNMRPEELVLFARQARAIESDLNTRIGETQNMARGGANSIQVVQQVQDLQKKLAFIMSFALKLNQEVMVRKDKGAFPIHLLQQIPAPSGGPLPRTLPNGMTNPDWLKAHGAPPDLFTNGAYPQHEVQAAVDRMRQTILSQNAGPQATQNQLAQLQALQNQHAAQRAPSRQNGPPNPASTPGLPHASPMPQPANVNPQQAPPQQQQPGGPQPGGGAGPMTAAELTQRLSRLPPCEENMFVRMWPMWVKQTGQMLSMDDIPPPETLQGKPSISLYRLHAAVWQVGGHDTVGERWPMVAGRLGWGTMTDPTQGAALAPPMAAERLRQHHVTHLKEFDKFYYNLQRQKLLQHMQNQQGQPRLGPEKLQQAMQAAALGASSDELRARGIGDDVIAFVEQHREALVQKHREQTAFKAGLQGQQQQGQQQQQQMHPGQQQQQQQQQIQAQMNGVGVGGMGGAVGNNGMHPQPVPGPVPGQGQGLPQGQQPPQVGSLSPDQIRALAQRTTQLFGPLPSARELKGVRPDGSIDPNMYRGAAESVTKMKRSIEPQLTSRFQHVDPPVDVDRNEWMVLLERGSVLAADIEKTLPTFIAYTQGPHLANILSKVRPFRSYPCFRITWYHSC